jgi:arginase family enzyme
MTRRLPGSLRDLPWEPAPSFLGLDEASTDFDRARAVILPVPYESTTSWGGGAGRGPAAILEASRYVEVYDPELEDEPARHGIHTLPALELTRMAAALGYRSGPDHYRLRGLQGASRRARRGTNR